MATNNEDHAAAQQLMTRLSQIRGNIMSLHCASVSQFVLQVVLEITALCMLAAPAVTLRITAKEVNLGNGSTLLTQTA